MLDYLAPKKRKAEVRAFFHLDEALKGRRALLERTVEKMKLRIGAIVFDAFFFTYHFIAFP